MGKHLTIEVTHDVIRYNSFGLKDPKGKYVLYIDHMNRLNKLHDVLDKMYNIMINNVNDMFK